jgi:hypothetical protein
MEDVVKALAHEVAKDERAPSTLVSTVRSVNYQSNTVTVAIRGVEYALDCRRSYLNRAVGDQVLVTVRPGQMIVDGPVGAPYSDTAASAGPETISDLSPPGSVGWQEIVTGQVWVRQLLAGGPVEKWYKRLTAYTPPPPTVTTPATLTLTAKAADTYQNDVGQGWGLPEQGDDTGLGMLTGIWVFGGGAWVPLAGKTIVGTRVRIRRTNHGPATPQPAHLWLHWAYEMPQSTPELFGPELIVGPLSRGQEWTGGAPFQWGTLFQAETALGVGMFTTNPAETVQAYADLTVFVDYY